MDLLKIYDWGTQFLKEYPALSERHEKFKKGIIQLHTKESLAQQCQMRREGKSDEAIKCTIAVQYTLSLLLLMTGIFQFISHLSLFSLILNVLFSLLFYYLGSLNSESLKYPKSSLDKQTEKVNEPENKLQEMGLQKVNDTVKPKQEKTLFWRIYGYVNTLCAWGWVYVSLMQPEALKKWLVQTKIMDYIPHEAGAIETWNETYLLFGGIIFISVVFSVMAAILKAISFIFEKLFPKRDIREL